ncbi:MAG: hypothetical protein IH825_08050 [Candidatus Marinimicrobia bacterium]|nr:hypothetical protein [Candidatus Neomarinimicrobiota bacterium]
MSVIASNFDAGFRKSNNNPVNWSSDIDWIITIASLDINLGQSDDTSYTKPLSDLEWKTSPQPTWITMLTTDATVDTGTSGSGSIDIDYKFLLAWDTDRPGTYGATVRYTIASN